LIAALRRVCAEDALADQTPFLNYAYLIDALSIHDTSTTLQDQLYQDARSSGCALPVSTCVDSYILASSLTDPFVPNLSFTQRIHENNGFNPGCAAYFAYTENNGTPSGITTIFYGTIDKLRVNQGPQLKALTTTAPEPATLWLLPLGFIGLAVVGRGRKRKSCG
jgi:hypothetical protein